MGLFHRGVLEIIWGIVGEICRKDPVDGFKKVQYFGQFVGELLKCFGLAAYLPVQNGRVPLDVDLRPWESVVG